MRLKWGGTLWTRSLVAVLALAMAACSGGAGHSAIPSVGSGPAAAAPSVQFTIVLNKPHTKKKGRHPRYIPVNTESATIAVGNATPVVADLTPKSAGCSGTPLKCTVDVPAPPGEDTFTVTLYGETGAGGKALSTGVVVADVLVGKTNDVIVVCDGIIATLGLTAPQPNPPYGLVQTVPLIVSAKDADGNTIVSPGDFESAISLSDSDPTHTKLKIGTGTPATTVSIPQPGQIVDVTYDGSSALASATITASVPGSTSVAPSSVTLTPKAAQIVVDVANGGPAIAPDLLGANLPAWTDNTQSYVETSMAGAGLHLLRWPGGSFADDYHWGENSTSPSACAGAYFYPSSTFDNMMTDVAGPASLDVAITLNYGSNVACNGPGDPLEAKAWVAYSKSKGYDVKYWTVGNENYGFWEEDLHASPQDPTTYATAVDTKTTGYYDEIKAADPNAKVGVVVGGPEFYDAWDTTVLSQAAGHYDFVEYHYYAQQGVSAGTGPGDAESDSYLLGQGVTDFVTALSGLRQEMNHQSVPRTVPIYLGELNSIVGTAGKQTTSITNGLFAGMAMAEVMKLPATDNVGMASWWLAFGDCETSASGGNFSGSLYGWQNFGTYTLFSDQSSGCGTENTVPAGTRFPDGQAYALLSQFASSGSVIRNVTTSLSTANARVYADTIGSGYGVLLFNLSETTPATYSVALGNSAQSQFTGTQIVYGKAQYDESDQTPVVWEGPVSSSLGTVGTTFSVTLPPWSMNLVKLVPVAADARHRVR